MSYIYNTYQLSHLENKNKIISYEFHKESILWICRWNIWRNGFRGKDGGQIFAIASMALGGAAMVSALIVRNQIKRIKLETDVALKMR